MEYLNPIEIFIIKKLLLEANKKFKKYVLKDFNEYGFWVIVRCLLFLHKKGYIVLAKIEIEKKFFEKIFGDFIIVDYVEEDRKTYTNIGLKKIEDLDYAGLGKKLFNRYEQENSFENDILDPITNLEINISELEYILNNTSKFHIPEEDTLSENLIFNITQTGVQKDSLNKYLKTYLKEFQGDNLERENATDYYKYTKQIERTENTIKHFGKDYPIKNLWLKEEDIEKHGLGNELFDNFLLKNYNFLETLLCLENNGKIKINGLDPKKGVNITSCILSKEKESTPTSGLIGAKKTKNYGKIDILVDNEKGIYRNEKLCYPIRIKSARFRIIKQLNEKRSPTSISEIKLLTGQKEQLISKEIREINRLVRKNLKVKNKFIVHIDTGGYKLNDKKYNIIWKTL